MKHAMSMEVEGFDRLAGVGAEATASKLADRFWSQAISRGTLEVALWLAYVQGRADEQATEAAKPRAGS